jgi:hypothetical protein
VLFNFYKKRSADFCGKKKKMQRKREDAFFCALIFLVIQKVFFALKNALLFIFCECRGAGFVSKSIKF